MGGATDGELLVAARDGDARAWDALYDRRKARVWAVARAHRLSHQDAQDVCQLTWMLLLTHMKTIREPESVGAWLASTARHESLRLLKRSGRQIPTGDAFEFEGPDQMAPSPDARLLGTERQKAVWEALELLKPECQRLLRLRMAEFSYKDICQLLGRPPGSIGPTQRRCMDQLRERLVGFDDEGRPS